MTEPDQAHLIADVVVSRKVSGKYWRVLLGSIRHQGSEYP